MGYKLHGGKPEEEQDKMFGFYYSKKVMMLVGNSIKILRENQHTDNRVDKGMRKKGNQRQLLESSYLIF